MERDCAIGLGESWVVLEIFRQLLSRERDEHARTINPDFAPKDAPP
jgi:hypothetical protein